MEYRFYYFNRTTALIVIYLQSIFIVHNSFKSTYARVFTWKIRAKMGSSPLTVRVSRAVSPEVCRLECLYGHCRNQRCVCDQGWTGALCDQLQCDHRCHTHGFCSNGSCVCDKGWNGKHCTIGKLHVLCVFSTSSDADTYTCIRA